MNLKEIKQLTDNFTNIKKWEEHIKNNNTKMSSATFRRLPNNYKHIYYITKFKIIHQNKYEYPSKDWWNQNYKSNKTKIPIICPIHGEFWQSIGSHLNSHGCRRCNTHINIINKNRRMSYKEFLNKVKNKTNNFEYPFDEDWWNYNYNKNSNMRIPIKCKKCGEMFTQILGNHIYRDRGCPICNFSKGEIKIKNFLDDNDISYIHQYKVEINKYKYYFDFFLPQYNILIEYDGIQHFEPLKHFGGNNEFGKIQQRDEIKNQYAKQNSIKLIRIPFYKYNKIEEILQKELYE